MLSLPLIMLSLIKLMMFIYVKTLIMFNAIFRTGPRVTHTVRAVDLVPPGTMLVTFDIFNGFRSMPSIAKKFNQLHEIFILHARSWHSVN